MHRLAAILIPLALTLGSCATTPVPDPVDQEIENLRAFAKLYGYIRWFHPSDEAATIDWDRFAIHGAERVAKATNPHELAELLDGLFRPLAPTLGLTVKRTRIGAPADVGCDAANAVTAWEHMGVRLGPASNVYRSSRARWDRADAAARRDPEAYLARAIQAHPYRGQVVQVESALRSTDGAYLWLRIDREDGAPPVLENSPAATAEWGPAALSAKVPDDAVLIVYGIALTGSGMHSLAGVDVAVNDGGQWLDVSPLNSDFTAGLYGDMPRGWTLNGRGYEVSMGAGPTTEAAVTIGPSSERYPLPDDRITRSIGPGIEASFPTALYIANDATCPRSDEASLQALHDALAEIDTDRTAADRGIRDGGIVIGWSALQHFYPYFDEVAVDWDERLTATLIRSRQDLDGRDYLSSLRHLLEGLDDGHGNALHPSMRENRFPQFSVDDIEGEIVVVASVHDSIEPGDSIVALDGTPARQVVTRLQGAVPGSPQHKHARALAELGWGAGDAELQVVVRRDGHQFEVTTVRNQLRPLTEPRPEPITEIESGIWYVDISRVAELGSVNQLAAADGVIFDMRGYPRDFKASALGHLTDTDLMSPQWHRPHAVLPDQERVEYDVGGWQVPPRMPRFTGTPVFLTGSRAISAAETFMGIVEGYELGEIVGQPTAGANGNINMINLPGGYALIFTGLKVRKHDGSPHHVVGIRPTVPVERTIEAVREGRDEYIEKAVEIIRAQAGER